MIRLLAILILLPWSAFAATHTCSSCALAVVQATNDLAAVVNGDTIAIPAGTCDWTDTLLLTNKAIRLTGAGVGSTIIRDRASGPGAELIHIWLQAGYTTEIDNIEFQYVDGDTTDRVYIEGLNTDNRNINFHHCKFDGFSAVTPFLTDTVTGVIHHNNFWNVGLVAHVKASYYNGTFGVRDYGNQSMYAPDLFGTTNFVFFEDNFVTNSTSAIDAQAGGRYVWRFNTNYNFNAQTHGSEAAERSGRGGEVYGNRFYNNVSLGQGTFFRGGVWLNFSNYWEGWPAGANFNLIDNRVNEHLFPSYWGGTGVNPWDTNASGIYTNGTVSNTGGPLNNTITDFSKAMTTDIYKHHQIVRTSGKVVTSITRAGSTATATVTGHGFSTGNYISFWGANEYSWNGVWTITVTGTDTFTFVTHHDYPTPATGTIKCAVGNNFARILSNTATNITFNNSIYGDAYSLRMTNADTYEVRRVIVSIDQVGVYGGSNFLTAALPDIYNTFAGAQTASACWSWGHTFADTVMDWTTTFAGGGDWNHIIPGKHYTNGTAKPGYSPYTYPHPIASGAACNTPTAPSSLSANTISSVQINVGWNDNASDEDGFEVDRALDSGFTSSLVTTGGIGPNEVSYASTGLSPSTQYYYRVRATNECGASSYSSSANATTLADGPQGTLKPGKGKHKGRGP